MAYSEVAPLVSPSSLQFNPAWIDALFSPGQQVYLGFSGGVDSHVLLHALVAQLSESQIHQLTAIHVHHGLSESADDWVVHCESVCHSLGIRFIAKRVILQEQASVEEAARNARYQAFQSIMTNDGVLLLAHHRGDQAETVLFRLLRGTGGKGLSGIPEQRVFAGSEARLVRPFLTLDKQVLQDYAQQHHLCWVEDESNEDERFTRNFLRQGVIPVLKTRFPQMEQQISVTAQRIAADYRILAGFANQQLDQWCDEYAGLPLRFVVEKPREERLFWLRYFLLRWDISLPHSQLGSIDGMFLSAEDKQPEFAFSHGRLMRHQHVLYLLPSDQCVVLGGLAEGIALERSFDRVVLISTQTKTDQDNQDCELRSRPQGASLVMPNGKTRKLKKWLNDQQIPSWWRDHLPYVFQGDTLIAIGDLWRHPDWQGELRWQRSPDLPWITKSV
ncbi:tRNA lysidine(34) synthetase TilS [Marinomonas sp. A79]|uniref:tRNA(Ile)-lysidine synthase n=1 Tax=Marinomonas vulgaris TaxID=2823372 RepID=A0ABS5H7B3_9GAMM|nr:tRNA lysidine(34) synthetase TilS [Marinomonas vulgaris]MBR7887332.1 tRNA lysidine(34) synthetase TilS [Marinomonas vulgaris]